MQMLYGYDVVADLAPRTGYDEVVRALGGAGETVTDPRQIGPALDRAFAAGVPYLRQRDHRRRRGLPAHHVRDLRRCGVRRAAPRGARRRSARSPSRRTPPFVHGPDDSYARPTCATPPRRDREAELWVATPRPDDRILGTVTICPPGSPWRECGASGEGEFRMLAVAPRRRAGGGRGAGRARASTVSRGRGDGAVVLSIAGRRCAAAHRVYERHGFRRDPRARLVAAARRHPDRLPLRAGTMTAPSPDATLAFTVTEDDTAAAVGSGSLPVLGTPRLLAWCEAATCAALDPSLAAGTTSVGTRVELEHRAASPVGQRLEVTASDGVRRRPAAPVHGRGPARRRGPRGRHRRGHPGGRGRRAVPGPGGPERPVAPHPLRGRPPLSPRPGGTPAPGSSRARSPRGWRWPWPGRPATARGRAGWSRTRG